MTTQHGGRRPGAGRKPGRVSKAKLDIAERAKTHGDAALMTLAEIMRDVDAPHSARVSAANALLDRGYGRPQQAVDHTSSDGSMQPITGFDVRIASAPASDTDAASG